MEAVLVKCREDLLINQYLFGKRLIIISGSIKKMPGRVLCLDLESGQPYILQPENLRELTENEI